MIDFYAADQPEHLALREMLAQKILSSSDAGYWHALIDRAFDYNKRQWQGFHGNESPLYSQGRLAALNDASPCLLRLADLAENELKKRIGSMLFHCRGRPMLSFIQTHRTTEQLSEDWQAFLEVETSDEQRYLLRFADTRVLPEIARCTPRLWSALTANIGAWWMINRAGELESLPLKKTTAAATQETALNHLEDPEFSCLLESGLPDALADRLNEHFPELLSERSGFANYQLLLATCALAKRHGLESFPEQMALSAAILFSNGKLLTQPEFTVWLEKKSWGTNALEDALGEYLEQAGA